MKTAIIHEWFINYWGSEKCVESFVNILPKSDIFALIDFLKKEDRIKILNGKKAKTSFIQKFPFAKSKYRNYLSFFPMAIEQLDISNYDLIISSNHSVSKGVLSNSNQLHISYCHSPMRYAWDLYFQYVNKSYFASGLKSWYARRLFHKIRIWDFISASRVDYFIANSNHIAKRIKKIYNRDCIVIHPPVDIKNFLLNTQKDNYYLTVSRFVPYKKVDLIVDTFSQMPDKRLVVIGDGPDKKRIKKIASKNVELLGFQSMDNLANYMRNAKAFIFASEEDFGITMVEAQACGTPVIAYRIGGASEIVKDRKTGILFDKQNPTELKRAIEEFEKMENDFDLLEIRRHAENFDRKIFEEKIRLFIDEKWKEFKNNSQIN
jgi:glycosyltransferase involved in cell wall biosynthesis